MNHARLSRTQAQHLAASGRTGRLRLILTTAALFLGACGGSAVTTQPTQPTPSAETSPGETPAPSFAPGGSATGIIEEFGMNEAQLVASIESVESGIATCMVDAGFEYVPIDPVTFRAAQNAIGSVPGVSDADFVAQYGYGISTLPPAQDFRLSEQNKRIYDGLAPAEQVAYSRTLLGDDTSATFMVSLENEDFSSTGGCTRTAIEQALKPDQLSATYVNPFDVLIEQDPRMVAAREQWSACTHDAGYDFQRQSDAEDQITERLAVVTGGADPATLTGSAKQALTALQGEERAIALADLDCAKRFVDDVALQVEHDITGR